MADIVPVQSPDVQNAYNALESRGTPYPAGTPPQPGILWKHDPVTGLAMQVVVNALDPETAALHQTHRNQEALQFAALISALQQAHQDSVSDQAGLATLHFDLGTTAHADAAAILAALGKLTDIAASTQATLVLQQKSAAMRASWSASLTSATTANLKVDGGSTSAKAGTNGTRLEAVSLSCPALLTGVLAGTAATVTLFHTALAGDALAAGTQIGNFAVLVGMPVSLPLGMDVPPGRYVKAVNALGRVDVSVAARDL